MKFKPHNIDLVTCKNLFIIVSRAFVARLILKYINIFTKIDKVGTFTYKKKIVL